ncbi:MAG: molybdenum cofactor guanylyltransferase, partial [Gemmatimonadaceae bacterium]
MLGGRRIADHALNALRGATTAQCIVANDPAAARWFPGDRIIVDEMPGLGPLAGIASALRAAGGAAVLVVAWDMPFVTPELLGELRMRGERGASAVVPVHGPRARPEPLCAWYGGECLETCRALLDSGERRASALYEALTGTDALGDGALARFGDASRVFMSVDTPAR